MLNDFLIGLAAKIFLAIPKPARIHSPDPFLRAGEFSRGFAKSFPPENSFGKTESVLKPRALPEYLEGRTPKEKHPFLFQKKFAHRQIRNAGSVFSFGVAGVLASVWGFLRAYALVSSHHALRACHIICFENKCELGTIQTLFIKLYHWPLLCALFCPLDPKRQPTDPPATPFHQGLFEIKGMFESCVIGA